MKHILMVLAPDNFRDAEYIVLRAFWEQFGIRVSTASFSPVSTGRFGYRVNCNILLKDAAAEDYEGLFFVGGNGSLVYRDNLVAKTLADNFLRQQKFVGAICAAPQNLVHWGMLDGKKCTGYNDDGELARICQEHGTTYVDSQTVTDSQICTGKGPAACEETALAFMQLLNQD